MKILLQYRTSSKVKEIFDPNEIYNVIELTFSIKREYFSLQKYDEDFKEYVDLEDLSTLQDKSKIKIIELVVNPFCEINNFPSNVSPTIVSQTITDAEVEVILDLRSQWPASVTLPITDFSKPLLKALEGEQELSWSLSSELVSHLATYAYKFKRYPNKVQRIQICEALIQTFPYLRNNIGLGIGGWELKLLNKLKKMRQNDTSLETELNRSKRKSIDSTMPKKIKLNPERGEVNWAPDHIQGEDEATQKMHKQIMLEESKISLSHQDKIKLKSLMALTYSFRRNLINKNATIKYLKEEYPIFFQNEEQFDEFERLTSINMKESFFNEVQTHGHKLFELFLEKKSDSLKKLKNDVETILQSLEGASYLTAKNIIGIYVLPCLLKEPLDYFVEVVS